jgi:ATP-dependent exoDNAse (exonuclease V) beta subunit
MCLSGILVRDEVARARVQEQTSNQALVLTVVDSKGLEFDDVRISSIFSVFSRHNDHHPGPPGQLL